MKISYRFSTDGKLRLDWFEDGLQGLFGFDPASSMGRKYYEVFPKIAIGRKDAVLMAARGVPVRLKDKCFKFPNGQFFADVVIKKRSAGKTGPGAKVFIYPKNSCELARQLQNSQPLIDIGKIASILAHGVRNPLNAIKGAVVYLRDRYPAEQTLLEFTNLMEDEITRLDKFISSFLSTSIAEASQEVDLNQIVKKIEVFISLQSISKAVKARFLYGGVPRVHINPFQLEQAILNVVNNALEAMSGGGTLSVSTFFERKEKEKENENSSGRGFAVITISDTGPGLLGGGKQKQVPAGAACRADGYSLAAGAKGRGFGLFLTREIIRYWGGMLQIESRQDAGTTVRLCIPAQAPHAGPPGAAGASTGPA